MADTIPINPVRLKKFRGAPLNMTQEMLAKRSGLSRSFISDLESGRRQPRLLAARSISQALGVTVEDLCVMD